MVSRLATREKKSTREIVEIGGRKSRKKYSSSWTPVVTLPVRSNVPRGDVRVFGIIERPFGDCVITKKDLRFGPRD